jgi:uncharacterized membrane protein YgdD (TMEM256/DUF423 family)
MRGISTSKECDGQRRQTHAARQDLQGQLRQEAAAALQEDQQARLRPLLATGAILAAAAVALGAFGAHGLKSRLSAEMLAVWDTAVQYHFWHALGVLAIALAAAQLPGAWVRAAGWLLVAGTALFSGTLYALALGAPRALGAITPVGGALLIAGWLAFAVSVIFSRTPA